MKRYQVTVGGATYSVEVEDPSGRPMRVRVDGDLLLVDVADENLRLSSESPSHQPRRAGLPTGQGGSPVAGTGLSPASLPGSTAHTLTAPIPGVVTSVAAKPDQVVQRGDELLTIEAMKMFNVIRSPQAGVVAEVHVTEGQRVAQGQLLLTFVLPA